MKRIQLFRLFIQFAFMFLTIIGLLASFKEAMLIIIGATIILGPIYCGWLCPYGFIQDIFSKLGRSLGIKKVKMPVPLQRILMFARYIVFAIVLIIAADFVFTLMSFDPRSNFETILSGNMVKISAIAVIAFFALISMFFERPFCNYFCYEGAKYGLIGMLRPLTIKRNAEACVNCKKCDKACPMNIQVSKCSNLRSPQCINCMECVLACPVKNTLSYGLISYNKAQRKKYYAAALIVIVILAGFMFNNINNANSSDLIEPPIAQEDVNAEAPPEQQIQEDQTINIDDTQDTPLISDNNTADTVVETEKPKAEDKKQANSSSNDQVQNDSTDEKQSTDSQPSIPAVSESTTVPSDNTTDTANLGDAKGIADGTYTGSGDGFRGSITVEVTVKSQQIVSVVVVDQNDDAKWFNRANSMIPDRIVEAQTADVDAVGGATFSSMGIIDAVKDALKNAK